MISFYHLTFQTLRGPTGFCAGQCIQKLQIYKFNIAKVKANVIEVRTEKAVPTDRFNLVKAGIFPLGRMQVRRYEIELRISRYILNMRR
jgi:hypothetical protein